MQICRTISDSTGVKFKYLLARFFSPTAVLVAYKLVINMKPFQKSPEIYIRIFTARCSWRAKYSKTVLSREQFF